MRKCSCVERGYFALQVERFLKCFGPILCGGDAKLRETLNALFRADMRRIDALTSLRLRDCLAPVDCETMLD